MKPRKSAVWKPDQDSFSEPEKDISPEELVATAHDGNHETAVDTYYVRSTDSHGHSLNVKSTNVPKCFGALAAFIVDDPRTPYKTLTDLAGDAFMHRCIELYQHLNATTMDDPIYREAIMAAAHIESIEIEKSRQQALMDTIKFVQLLMSHRDWDRARDAVFEYDPIVISYSPKLQDAWAEFRTNALTAIRQKMDAHLRVPRELDDLD